MPVLENVKPVKASIHELEQVHGLRMNYTAACNSNETIFSYKQRLSLIRKRLYAHTLKEKLNSFSFYFALRTINK